MPAEFWNALIQFFSSSHNVNLASLTAGAFAGLYGYQFLGKGGKTVQQIFVAAPISLAYGIFFYVIDSQTSFAYSSMIQSLLQLPPALHVWKLFPAFGAVLGFLHGLINPNLFRERAKREPRWRRIAARTLQGIEFSGLLLISLSINIARLSWFEGMRLPIPLFPLLIGLSIGAGCCWAVIPDFSEQSMAFDRVLDRARAWVIADWTENVSSLRAYFGLAFRTLIALVVTAVALLLIVAGVGSLALVHFTYAIVVMRFGFLAPYLFFLFLTLIVGRVQREIDSESAASQFFLYLSFICFAVAVALQVYQAVAFSGS